MGTPNIIVTIKQVPDPSRNLRTTAEGAIDREKTPAVMNRYCRNAVEEALRLKDAHGGQVSVITMGPPKAELALREAIAMGCDRGILLTDRKLAGSDTWATAYALSKVAERISTEFGKTDIFLTGMQTTDGDTAHVGPQLAERLSEAKDMLSARGIQFRDRHLLLRLRARLPLLKIGLLTALEGSWQTAEALEARAFGSGKRSVYATHDWRFPDFALLVSGALLWLWLFFSWVTGEGRFLFYPTLEPVLSTFHPVPFFVFLSGLALVPVCGAKYPR